MKHKVYQGNNEKDKSHYARCLTLLTAFRIRHIKRLVALFALLCVNIYFHVLTFGVKYGGASFAQARAFELPLSDLPFAMGVVSATCSLVLLFLAFFAEVKRPKLLIPFFLIAAAATYLDLIHWAIGAVIILVYVFQIVDNVKFKWVEKQPGYPHFNERLDDQIKTFAAIHALDELARKNVPEWEIPEDREDDDTWDGDVLNLDAIAQYIGLDDEDEEEPEEQEHPDEEGGNNHADV